MVNTTVTPKPQPEARPGEVVVTMGRWNEAALRQLLKSPDENLSWVKGTLGYAVMKGDKVIGRLNRHRKGLPWTIRVTGFEYWHEPTRIVSRWHYTAVWSAPTLAGAKRQIQLLFKPRFDAQAIP